MLVLRYTVCVRVCLHVLGVCVHGRRGCYLASSMPQGGMTPGYAHAVEEGEASVDVPVLKLSQ